MNMSHFGIRILLISPTNTLVDITITSPSKTTTYLIQAVNLDSPYDLYGVTISPLALFPYSPNRITRTMFKVSIKTKNNAKQNKTKQNKTKQNKITK